MDEAGPFLDPSAAAGLLLLISVSVLITSDEWQSQLVWHHRCRPNACMSSPESGMPLCLKLACRADADLLEEDSRRQHARPAGPERPSWLPHSHEASPAKGEQAKPRKRKQKSEKKQKKGKKHKKDKQHKEKRRRSNEQSETEN